MPMVLTFAAFTLALASFAGMGYQIVAACRLRGYLKPSPPLRPATKPRISLLKPLCGAEPGMAANLRSSCRQDYPDYQILLGVADAADPALSVVATLSQEFPDRSFATIVDPRSHGCNLKVGNLLNMLGQADGEILVMADSDIRTPPDNLLDLAACLADPKVGVATCLYVGHPATREGDTGVGTLWSRLGAMGINHGFLPSALVARALGRKDGCFGATMAIRRDILNRLGGLTQLKDVLADDWALGALVRNAGLEIALASRPVDITVDEPSLKSLLAHEVRWGRTIAAIDRTSYMASVMTQPVALAFLCLLASSAAWPSLLVCALALGSRLWAVRSEERALQLPPAGLGELALRELLSFVVFLIACCGRSVEWRGRRFIIRRDGTLEYKEGNPT